MTIVGYFCTGGYTEVGGIKYFLEKINANIQWERCFPTALKPSPKFNRRVNVPCQEHSGVSGSNLITKMIERIGHPYFEYDKRYDCILLIDDLDCRFYKKDDEYIRAWINDIGKQVERALGREVGFETLFASPEVEVWFVADWMEGFGREYQKYDYMLRRVMDKIIKDHMGDIEKFGEPLENGSCKYKISEIIQSDFNQYVRYSKNVNGGSMLKRIRPQEVEKMCRRYYAEAYWKLYAIK